MGVDNHYVLKVSDVLNWIARYGVSVEGENQELPLKFTLLNISGEKRVMDVSSWDQVLRQLGPHDSFLDQLVESMEIQGSVVLEVAPDCVELFWRVLTCV